MGWQVKVGEHAYHLLTFSIEELDDLASEAGYHWWDIWPDPFRDKRPLGPSAAIVRVLAKRHDVELPDRMTPNDLFGYWTRVDDNLPAYFEDGMPDPKAEGETPPSTDGSSGELESTDGPLPSSDSSPSET